MRRIEEIKSTLERGEEGAAEIRAAARMLEERVSVEEVLAAVAEAGFPNRLVAASRECEGAEERAWLTLAAAGPRRARQVLAWKASELVDPAELGVLVLRRGSARAQAFERVAASVDEPAAAAAWRLLAHLRGSELRSMVRARPALAAVCRRAAAAGLGTRALAGTWCRLVLSSPGNNRRWSRSA
jgi:hypothetical protein